MQLQKEHEKLATAHKAAKYNFILTELDLALTFCDVALSADDREKADRNRENAQRAYDSATHFLEEAGFSGKGMATLQRKVSGLRTVLRQLNGRRKKASRRPALRPA